MIMKKLNACNSVPCREILSEMVSILEVVLVTVFAQLSSGKWDPQVNIWLCIVNMKGTVNGSYWYTDVFWVQVTAVPMML